MASQVGTSGGRHQVLASGRLTQALRVVLQEKETSPLEMSLFFRKRANYSTLRVFLRYL